MSHILPEIRDGRFWAEPMAADLKGRQTMLRILSADRQAALREVPAILKLRAAAVEALRSVRKKNKGH